MLMSFTQVGKILANKKERTFPLLRSIPVALRVTSLLMQLIFCSHFPNLELHRIKKRYDPNPLIYQTTGV